MHRQVGNVAAIETNLAGVGLHKTRSDVERGGLTGAIGPQKTNNLALGDTQGDIFDDISPPVALTNMVQRNFHALYSS